MNDAQYGYDATSQLTSAVYDKLPAEAYDYDANENRKAYETGKNNQLLSDGVFDYKYDEEGNRIEKRSKDSSTRYEWDHRNRLVRVLDNGKSVEYDYDYQNRLVRRNDELFVHDGWQIACSLKNGRIAHRYLWGAVQDELLAMDDAWALRDHLNTVRKVVSMKGKVISHLDYNAFGKLVSSTGERPLFRYTGKLFDDATGLQWNINRWYDANVGRWCSEDPIGFMGRDANLSRYVANGAIYRIDPQGLAAPALLAVFCVTFLANIAAGVVLIGVQEYIDLCKSCASGSPPPACAQPINACYRETDTEFVIMTVGGTVEMDFVGKCTRHCGWLMYYTCCWNKTGTYVGRGIHECVIEKNVYTFKLKHPTQTPKPPKNPPEVPGYGCNAPSCGGLCTDGGFTYGGKA